jgi:hypothetical protein
MASREAQHDQAGDHHWCAPRSVDNGKRDQGCDEADHSEPQRGGECHGGVGEADRLQNGWRVKQHHALTRKHGQEHQHEPD